MKRQNNKSIPPKDKKGNAPVPPWRDFHHSPTGSSLLGESSRFPDNFKSQALRSMADNRKLRSLSQSPTKFIDSKIKGNSFIKNPATSKRNASVEPVVCKKNIDSDVNTLNSALFSLEKRIRNNLNSLNKEPENFENTAKHDSRTHKLDRMRNEKKVAEIEEKLSIPSRKSITSSSLKSKNSSLQPSIGTIAPKVSFAKKGSIASQVQSNGNEQPKQFLAPAANSKSRQTPPQVKNLPRSNDFDQIASKSGTSLANSKPPSNRISPIDTKPSFGNPKTATALQKEISNFKIALKPEKELPTRISNKLLRSEEASKNSSLQDTEELEERIAKKLQKYSILYEKEESNVGESLRKQVILEQEDALGNVSRKSPYEAATGKQ